MDKDIKWDRTTNFTGRNGFMKCSGVELMVTSQDEVIISPFTSRGEIGRCDIWIPREALAEVIAGLQSIQDHGFDFWDALKREREEAKSK